MKELWNAAVSLRGNIEPADYKRYVLPLIFLRFLSLRYEKRRAEIDVEIADPKSEFHTKDKQMMLVLREDPDLYMAKNVFLVPEEARWENIVKIARADDVKLQLDKIMGRLEEAFPKLKGLLPPIYAGSNLDRENVAGLVNLFSKEIFRGDGGGIDMLCHTWDCFLVEFANSEGMWLTGTDIPCLHTLYVDKPMKGHTLMQAIARVNHIFQDKPGGLIVDFIGIGDQLKLATKRYTQGGGTGKPAPNLDEEAKAAFMQCIEAIREMLPTLPEGQTWGNWRAWSNIEFEDLFVKCCGHLVETDDTRDAFLNAEAKLSSAFSLVNHLPECLALADEIVYHQLLRKQLNKTKPGAAKKDENKQKAVRDLLDRSIESKGITDIFAASGIDKPDISILDEAFLAEFKTHEEENLRLKLLQKILADEIEVREKSNVTKYKSFKQMLEDTLKKYHNRAIQAADVVRVLVQMKKDMDRDAARTKQLNLSPEELAFYDAVAANAATLYDETLLCDIVRDVVQAVKRNLDVDWTKPHREDVKAGVRAAVRSVLLRRGVKAEHLEPLIRNVIAQAEAMFREWPLAAAA